ncbi:WecB/TagA/CpsF family glycosyltransferase [Pseudoalteromonas rubra]|uniref:Glycosyltransferase n=1 Tax=Pseudoalteromonas rubra TaxID=43658 RepID=A0A5S3WYI2_9GAMM|nr:WecB/TagA/CpsF family glycosyltransferase [Pseudoalteromonas rubra]TMP36631.1 hypothetical protein CWB98_13470 [Pseudoalteromonas rubra]
MCEYFAELDSKLSSKEEWERRIEQLYCSKETEQRLVATFVNPFSYPVLLEEPSLFRQFDLIFSDGLLHTRLHNAFCDNKIDRVSFDLSSIASDTLARAEANNLKVAFVGGKYEHAQTLPEKLLELFPKLNIAYCRDGYFNSDIEKEHCFEQLNLAVPDIVIVGMGTPLQEKFLVQCVEKVSNVKEFYTCGGFLEQTATKGDYYHPLVKKLGLRWLQRAYRHSHVRKRLLQDYPKFVVSYIRRHI